MCLDMFNEGYKFQVVISAEVPLKYLFSDEKPSDIYLQDENRALMDDLALSSDSVSFYFLPNNKEHLKIGKPFKVSMTNKNIVACLFWMQLFNVLFY